MNSDNEVLKMGFAFRCDFENKSYGLQLLEDIKGEAVRVRFFAPQYRCKFDTSKYENVRKGRKGLCCSVTAIDRGRHAENL